MPTKLSIIGEIVNFRYRSDNFTVCNVLVSDIEKKADNKDSNKDSNNNNRQKYLPQFKNQSNKNTLFNFSSPMSSVGALPSKGEVIPVIGDFSTISAIKGLKYHFDGIWKQSKWGYQLSLIDGNLLPPDRKEGIIKFLSSGIVKGIGPEMAKRIVDTFGNNTLKIIADNPERLFEVKGIGDKKAEQITTSCAEELKDAVRIIELCSIGLSVTYAKKVLHHFTSEESLSDTAILKKIKDNPYILTRVRGIGFIKADEIARKLGIALDDKERIKAGIIYALENAVSNEGHTYLPDGLLIQKAANILSIPEEFECDSNMVKEELTDTPGFIIKDHKVYFKYLYEAEKSVVNRIRMMLFEGYRIKKDVIIFLVNKIDTLTKEQKDAVIGCLTGGLAVITGLPGTGKTYSLNAIINILEELKLSYALAAPTGKAAKRIRELTGKDAKTIHRLLGFKWSKDIQKLYFEKDKNNPLTEDFIIIDEASMVDILLMDNLLKAINKKTSLILVGDCNQLPSISPGKVLQDLINSGYCSVYELKKIQRQAADSSIIKAAHAVYQGQNINFPHQKDDLYFIETEDPEEIAEFIKIAVEDERYGPLENLQILSPTKKGPVGTERLNEMLKGICREKNLKVLREKGFIRQDEKTITEKEIATNHKKFSIGDKVIQLENNYEKEVFNGEIGYIIGIDKEDETTKVLFDNKEVIYHDYDMDQIGLAYALTVHKFQGSEADCVILPVTTSQYIMLYRNLFYTAITRARKRLCLVGTYKALNIAIKNNRQVVRYSDFN